MVKIRNKAWSRGHRYVYTCKSQVGKLSAVKFIAGTKVYPIRQMQQGCTCWCKSVPQTDDFSDHLGAQWGYVLTV